jgi:4-amino-4-deoxy-L-arabinose transferase-like glycosyltransferase
VSLLQHGVRIFVLMVAAAGLFAWLNYHTEVTFADGLRSIQQAEAIDRGAWPEGMIRSVDHPLHPLAIAAVHRLIGGSGPVSWQRAAQGASVLSAVFLVIPIYLLTLEIFGPSTAWLGCLLAIANPVLAHVVTNVLSESTFLLFWAWGLWGAVRFLREGRFVWLPLTIAFGSLAYMARPEGMLLPLALVATLVVLPLHRAIRIYWPRWWAAVAFLVLGSICLVGPYMAAKGGVGTRPAIARLIGTEPPAPALALERDHPLPPDQTTFETYHLAVRRVFRAFQGAVGIPLLALGVLGLLVARPWTVRARIWLFTGIILGLSALALVRLHVTGGYCTVRHTLVPALFFWLAAAHGLAWLIRSIAIDGRWLGLAEGRFRPGPAPWGLALAALVAMPLLQFTTHVPGSFAAYRDAGHWLSVVTAESPGRVLDMTDWSLFFSQQPGFNLKDIQTAASDPKTRWIVARYAHLRGHWVYSRILQDLVRGRQPTMLFPAHPRPGQLQIRVYDRWTPPSAAPPALAPIATPREELTRAPRPLERDLRQR